MDSLLSKLGGAELEDFGVKSLQATLDDRAIPGVKVDITKRSAGPKSRFHELHIEHPSLRTLLPGKRPYFPPPRNMEYRQRPQPNQLYEETLPFCTRYTTAKPVHASSLPDIPEYGDLVDIVDSILEHPGVTSMEVISFEADGEIIHNFFLTTIWFTGLDEHMGGRAEAEYRSFVLEDDQWQDLLQNECESDWVDLLDHLDSRACDASWLLVQEKLAAWNPQWATEEAARWTQTQLESLSVKELFAQLIRVTPLPDKYAQVGEGDEESINLVHVELPCRHVLTAHNSFLDNTSEDKLSSFCCPQCGAQVLGGNFEQLLKMREDQESRQQFASQDLERRVMFEMLDEMTGSFEIEPTRLLDALQTAQESLSLPSSILPAEVDPSENDETAELTVQLSEHFSRMQEPLIVHIDSGLAVTQLLEVSELILRKMHGLHDQALESVIPLHYDKFMKLWFSHAIGLLTVDQMQQEGTDEDDENGDAERALDCDSDDVDKMHMDTA